MPNYDAGAAVGKYILDTTAAERSLAAMSKRLQDFEALQKRVLSGRGGSGGGVSVEEVKIQQALARRASAEARLASEANKRLLIDQRIAQSGAQTALAEQRRQTELAKTANAEARAAASALRLQQQRERASRAGQNGGLGPALPRTFAGFTPEGFNQAVGAFGLATIGPQLVGQAVGAAVDAGKAALDLQRVQALTRALSGDQATYNKVVEAARQQQVLYGGSLADNIQKLSGLVTASRSSGAELETLINLSQRLAILDPAQGLEGAQIALREALSGDTRSLALRFEIPRSALTKLKDESIPVAERLLVIDQYLNKIGISGDVAAKTISDQAKAYNQLGVELDNLKTNTGNELAAGFEGAATGLGRLLGLINENPQAIAEIKAILGGRGSVSPEDVAREQAAATDRANRQRVRRFEVETLGGADTGAEKAVRAASIGLLPAEAAPQVTALQERYKALREEAVQLVGVSEDVATQVRAAVVAFGQTGDLDAFDLRIRSIEQAQRGVTASIPEYIAARQGATAADQDAAAQQQAVQQAVDLVRAGVIDQAGAVALLQSQYPGLGDEAEQLISQQLRLASAADEARRALGAQRLAGQRANTQNTPNERAGGPGTRGNTLDDFLKFVGEQQAAEEARDNQLVRTGTTLQQIEVLQKRYNAAVKDFGAESAQAVNAQTDLIAAQQAANKPKAGGSKGVSALDKDTIDAATTLAGELDAVNKLLERGNLTVHQRNDLLEKQRDLQQKIAGLTLDTSLAIARDAQKRLEENRTLAQNQKIIEGAQFSEEQKAAAQAESNVILLERQKRQRDIAQQAGDAGITGAPQAAAAGIPGAPGALPTLPALPQVPQLALPTAAALVPPPINISIPITINDRVVAPIPQVPGVNIEAAIVSGLRLGAAAGG